MRDKMKVFVGTDHRGFKLAEAIVFWMEENHISMNIAGAHTYDPNDDYVDYAVSVAKRIMQVKGYGHEDSVGIVFCGSGVGVDIVANKIKGIRCGLGFSEAQVRAARADDDINMLAIPADYLDEKTVKKLIQVFLETPFKNEEKYKRRIEKIAEIEQSL